MTVWQIAVLPRARGPGEGWFDHGGYEYSFGVKGTGGSGVHLKPTNPGRDA